MKTALYSLVVSTFSILPLRADLTIVYSTTVQPASQGQKAQATPNAVAAATNMTIKIKGDRARIDASSQITVIFDGRTGELIDLLNDQKTVVRISPEKMKAIADMLSKFNSKQAGSEKPRLTPTGQRETINGYDTEQYTYDGPDFKATYWIAPNYPNGAAVLAQLQSIKSEFWENARLSRFPWVADPNAHDRRHGKPGRRAWGRRLGPSYGNYQHDQRCKPRLDCRQPVYGAC